MITSLSVSNDPFLDPCKCNAISLFASIKREIYIMYIAYFFANNLKYIFNLGIQEINIKHILKKEHNLSSL